jgi:hypothetical protein
MCHPAAVDATYDDLVIDEETGASPELVVMQTFRASVARASLLP